MLISWGISHITRVAKQLIIKAYVIFDGDTNNGFRYLGEDLSYQGHAVVLLRSVCKTVVMKEPAPSHGQCEGRRRSGGRAQPSLADRARAAPGETALALRIGGENPRSSRGEPTPAESSRTEPKGAERQRRSTRPGRSRPNGASGPAAVYRRASRQPLVMTHPWALAWSKQRIL